MERVASVVIGAGQAGLAMSHHLSRLGCDHVVLERGRVAERWRSERWDSLVFQFPNWMMRLPGHAYAGDEPDGFMPRDGVAGFIAEYAVRIAAPVRCGTPVISLEAAACGGWTVRTRHSTLRAPNVVVATGAYQSPVVPRSSACIPRRVWQVCANRYSNPAQLPPGNALVVGAGASGYQIAEDLVAAGRRVYLSVGRHRRVPRRYRGRDYGWWLETTGALDRIAEQAPAPAAPILTGAHGGHDADLRALAARGVTLLGGLRGGAGGQLRFAPDIMRNLDAGDAAYAEFTRGVDEYVARHGLEVPAAEPPQPRAVSAPVASIPELDLERAGIRVVVWAAGYRPEFRWIRGLALDPHGRPAHRRGVSPLSGLYFLGLPRLYKAKSAFLWGVGEDAAYLAEHIARRK